MSAQIKTSPGTVPGGRIVHGRAMSGSPNCTDIPPPALERKIEARPKEGPLVKVAKRPMTPAARERRYKAAMEGRGWMATAMVAKFAGTTKEGAAHHLCKLLIEGLVEMKRDLGVGGNKHHVKFLWRWCAK